MFTMTRPRCHLSEEMSVKAIPPEIHLFYETLNETLVVVLLRTLKLVELLGLVEWIVEKE